VLRQRSVWSAAVARHIPIVCPLGGVHWSFFASHNLEIVAGKRASMESTFRDFHFFSGMARHACELTGPVPIAAAAGYVALVIWERDGDRRGERRLAVLMIVWFVTDYLFHLPRSPTTKIATGIFLTSTGRNLSGGAVVFRIPARGCWRVGPPLSSALLLLCSAIASDPGFPRVAGLWTPFRVHSS